jgi:hypothetical protein
VGHAWIVVGGWTGLGVARRLAVALDMSFVDDDGVPPSTSTAAPMALMILLLLLVCLDMPLLLAWQIWRLDKPTRMAWLKVVAEKCAFLLLVFMVGR